MLSFGTTSKIMAKVHEATFVACLIHSAPNGTEFSEAVVFIKEAIVKTFANKVNAEEHLAERVKNAYGRYPDELKKDPLYEDDTIQSDAVIIRNDGGDVSSFVIRKD